jgi:hypothetical protein
MRSPIVASLLALIAQVAGCARTPPPSQIFDLSLEDASFDLNAACPPAQTSASCDVPGLACSYGATTCVCNTGFWFCNPTGCPQNPQTGACTTNGTKCNYGLTTLYCVDNTWLQCGNGVGTRCVNPDIEGARCCPNEYMQGTNSCACSAGSIPTCSANHVHYVPCD